MNQPNGNFDVIVTIRLHEMQTPNPMIAQQAALSHINISALASLAHKPQVSVDVVERLAVIGGNHAQGT